MSVRSDAVRALPLTFAIFVIEALCSIHAALPLSLELARRPYLGGASAFDRAALLSLPLELAPALRVTGSQLLLVALTLLLLGPWLQMSWLVALDRPRTLGAALHEGAGHLARAWLVSLLVAALAVLLALPCLLLAYGAHHLLAQSDDASVRDLALLASLCPLAVIAFFSLTLHDLARAHALRHGALRSVRASLPWALRVSVQLRALGSCALGTALVITSQLLAPYVGALGLASLTTVALLQSALLGRLFIRSSWLSAALTCARATDAAVVAAFPREVEDDRVRQE